MTKPQMVSLISEKAEISKKAAAAVLDTLVNAIHGSLKEKGGKFRISSLGTFKVIEVNARRGVNPRTGKDMTIPAMRLPRFYPAKALKESVKGKK
ncbi:MAG: HU family DNA-binding protein [Desulfomonile tiedjei]|uniref:Viral histone-like protein n=1 Tax=Desulfomonile tiedjei TaxID=2358 RepID=A0A9D6UYE4_9BACT|nr:HU family DNA-binding protein [Desulfomonile tiedjei]